MELFDSDRNDWIAIDCHRIGFVAGDDSIVSEEIDAFAGCDWGTSYHFGLLILVVCIAISPDVLQLW